MQYKKINRYGFQNDSLANRYGIQAFSFRALVNAECIQCGLLLGAFVQHVLQVGTAGGYLILWQALQPKLPDGEAAADDGG